MPLAPMTDDYAPNGKPKVPDTWSDGDGNAMMVVGSVRREMRKARWTAAEIKDFSEEALSGDYDHVLQTCMAYTD